MSTAVPNTPTISTAELMRAGGQIAALRARGVSIWLDDLTRARVRSGELARLVESGVTGVTTNPSIFQQALSAGASYEEELSELASTGADARHAVRVVTIRDVQGACEVLHGVWERSSYRDGFVSYEVDPRLAHDRDATVAEAIELWEAVDRPNLMIKIPATDAGIEAAEEVLARGVSVNVTLLFSVGRYAQVQEAWVAGLRRAEEAGHDLGRISSVASFFVSRVDAAVEPLLVERGAELLRGDAAVANARLAHERFVAWRESPAVTALERAGAPVQRLLWASTGVKDERLSPTLYVDELVGEDTVNTMPEATIRAVAQSTSALHSVAQYAEARGVLAGLAAAGIDLDEIALTLESEGEAKFVKAWEGLLETTAAELVRLGGGAQLCDPA